MRLNKSISILLVAGAALLFSACQTNQNRDTQKKGEIASTASSDKNLKEEITLSETQITESEEILVENYPSGTLLVAVSQKDRALIENVVKTTSYDLDEKDAEGNTPLNLAVHANEVEIAKLLIDHQANINLQNAMEDSPYLYAAAQGKTEILAYMLDHAKPDLTVHNRFGGNALIPAAEKGHIENVRLLLSANQEPIDFQNNSGYTALIEAVALRDGSKLYQDIIKLLLANGANQSIRDNSGRTALDYANQYGYEEIKEILMANTY